MTSARSSAGAGVPPGHSGRLSEPWRETTTSGSICWMRTRSADRMRVIVGRIGRPHGLRGEVVIGVRTDEPDLRFTVGAVLDVERTPTAETGSQLTVAAKRWHSGHLLISFAGI